MEAVRRHDYSHLSGGQGELTTRTGPEELSNHAKRND